MRAIDEIIVHCAATRPEWMADASAEAKRDEIRRWHVDGNGWRDIGYHAVIDRDGTIVDGRPVEQPGAHCRGHNQKTLGVCLIGGHGSNENDRFADHFTQEQDLSLRAWLDWAQGRWPEIHKVSGHNEYAAKACPGFQVSRWLNNKPPVAGSPAKSSEVQTATGVTVGGAATAVTAVGALDGGTQLVVVGLGCLIVIGGAVLMRHEIKAWLRKRMADPA